MLESSATNAPVAAYSIAILSWLRFDRATVRRKIPPESRPAWRQAREFMAILGLIVVDLKSGFDLFPHARKRRPLRCGRGQHGADG